MKLSDTQLVILSSAGQRADRSTYPVETKLTGGALQKVLFGFLAKQLVEEIPATREDTIWREGTETGSASR
jgi:hypothetical protein